VVFASRAFRLLSAAIVAFVLLLLIAGLALTRRGQAEMELSDSAFHDGDLRSSITHARQAALAYVPGSAHVQAATERLEAIAKGAESEDNIPLALIAWDTLRLVQVRTDYPGRPSDPSQDRAEEGLRRLRAPSQSDE
jgi:hypothetical protein